MSDCLRPLWCDSRRAEELRQRLSGMQSQEYLLCGSLLKKKKSFKSLSILALSEKAKDKRVCACAQSLILPLCDPRNYNPPGSSFQGLFQARILEWVAISFSRGSSQPRDRTCVSCIGRQILYPCTIWEAPKKA